MTAPDTDLAARIERLESRLMHQEAAIDELTRTVLDQEQQARLQAETIRRLEELLRRLSRADIAAPGEEPPPPHY